MDIKQSSLSRYKSNKTNPSKHKSEAKSISDSANAKQTSHRNATSTTPDTSRLAWKEGQVIKGEIIDIRYNGVSILIDPGNQVVTARLEGDIPLSIGQNARFQVSNDPSPSEHLTLKYLPNEAKASYDTTVEKALTASNLPLSDRNKAIVTELLHHRMPIDKETLLSLVKLSHSNRDASPLTLVLMLKNQIPLTKANINQFEAYQNGTHQIIDDIHTISKNLSALYQNTASGQFMDVINLNSKLIDLINSPQVDTQSMNLSTSTSPLSVYLNPEDLLLLSKAVEQSLEIDHTISLEVKANLVNQITNGKMSLNDAGDIIRRLFHIEVVDIQKTMTEGIVDQRVLQLHSSSEQASTKIDAIINKLRIPLSAMHDVNVETNATGSKEVSLPTTALYNAIPELKTLLTSKDSANLYELLKDIPDIGSKEIHIMDGTIQINELLTLIKEGLPYLEEVAVKSLIESPIYHELLEESLHQKWTITPEKLSNKDSITNLYQDLLETMKDLSELVKISKEPMDTIRLGEPLKNIQENLNFMKDLNEMFTYLQLPIQFKDRDVHSDLYVFTKKNALKDKKDGLDVLLHLDMQNLGPMNIYIHMNHNQIKAKFYLDDATAARVLEDHLPSLTDSLQQKGYSFQGKLEPTYDKPDFSKDFIEQSAKDNYVQRYSFDIRT